MPAHFKDSRASSGKGSCCAANPGFATISLEDLSTEHYVAPFAKMDPRHLEIRDVEELRKEAGTSLRDRGPPLTLEDLQTNKQFGRPTGARPKNFGRKNQFQQFEPQMPDNIKMESWEDSMADRAGPLTLGDLEPNESFKRRMDRRAKENTFEERIKNKVQNPFDKAKNVSTLNQKSFKDFLRKKDVTLVLFYDGRWDDMNFTWYKNQFVEASKITTKPNYAFAAIDCGVEESLCRKEAVKKFPVLKLYAGDRAVTTVTDRKDVTPIRLKAYVEQWPDVPAKDCCV